MEENTKEYLLAEYAQIASSHFTTVQTISTFFRHYLLVMAIPGIAITYLFATPEIRLTVAQYHLDVFYFSGTIFAVVAIIGFLIFAYIVNLRLDAILYARTINGIRKSFYDSWAAPVSYKLRIRVLPQSTSAPSYVEPWYFSAVVAVFAVINSAYGSTSIQKKTHTPLI